MTIRIADARNLGKRENAQAVIILCVEHTGTIRGVSYGENKAKCDAIGFWLDGLMSNGLSRIPFETVFGWGNKGKPVPLGKHERRALLRSWGVLE